MLIYGITTLDDEVILEQLEGFKKSSLDEFPVAVVERLKNGVSIRLSFDKVEYGQGGVSLR